MQREAIEAFCERVHGLEMSDDCADICTKFNNLSSQLESKQEALKLLKSLAFPESDAPYARVLLLLDNSIKEVRAQQSRFDSFCDSVSLERVEICDELIHTMAPPPSAALLAGLLSALSMAHG